MHHLVKVLREFGYYDSAEGVTRTAKPGMLVNILCAAAERLVQAGYAEMVLPAAPLFGDSTKAPETPKKRRTNGNRDDDTAPPAPQA